MLLNIDKAIDNIRYTFRWTGMNMLVEKKYRDPIETLRYKLVFLLILLWLNTDLVLATLFLIQASKNNESFTTITYLCPSLTLTLLGDFKSISFAIYDDELNKLLSLLRKLEEIQNKEEQSKLKKDIVKKESMFINRLLKVANIVNWTLAISFPIMALVLIAVKYIKSKEVELRLPFLDFYPVDSRDIRYWPFLYFRQVSADLIVLFQLIGADYLFYIICTYIKIQFDLVNHDFERVVPKSKELVRNDPELRTRIVDLIKWHNEIIRCVELLDQIYSKSTLFNFAISCILICLCGFNVTVLEDGVVMFTFISFLSMSVLQCFGLCYFGDVLITSGTKTSDAIYNSNWYMADLSIRKQLNIVQMRAQKPCRLTAYKFSDVNLNVFTKVHLKRISMRRGELLQVIYDFEVLSSSWSYFALLRTVYDT